MARTRLTAEEVIAAIQECKGNVSSAAKKLGHSRYTIYKFMQSHPSVKAALDEARESMIDNVESVLYSKALAGEAWAVCFFLKTQAKGRGYIERSEITGRDGQAIETKGEVKHIIDSDTATTIFDILASAGAIRTDLDAPKDDEVHNSQPDA